MDLIHHFVDGIDLIGRFRNVIHIALHHAIDGLEGNSYSKKSQIMIYPSIS